MESDRMSCHTSVRKVYERIKEDGTAMSMMLLRNFMGASTYLPYIPEDQCMWKQMLKKPYMP